MSYVLGNHSSAGVYLREYNFTGRPRGIATTGGGIVGYSYMGAVDVAYTCLTVEDFISEFGKPHPSQGFMHYSALQFLASGAPLTVIRVDTHALTGGAYCTVDDPNDDVPNISLDNFNDGNGYPLGVYKPLDNLGFIESDPGIENILFYVCAANPGEWNNRLKISVTPKTLIGFAPGVYSDPTVFNIEVYMDFAGPNSYPVETFVVSREIKVDGFGNSLFIEDVINKQSKYIRVKNNPYSPATVPILTSSFVFIQGATNGNQATTSDIVKGWSKLRDRESIDARILINAGYSDPDVHQAMYDVSMFRHDAFAVLDIAPEEQHSSDAINYRYQTLNIDGSFAGLYTPDLYVDDPYNGISLYVPISGYAAYLLAYNEIRYGVTRASAGVESGKLEGVRGLRYTYNQDQRDALTTAGINMARAMPPTSGYSGFYLWNSATLSMTPSSEQEVTVRRLMNQIGLVLSQAFLVYAFSPSNLALRRELLSLASAYLDGLKANGDFSEYALQCDETNNPSYIIANGDLVFSVAIDAESAVPAKRILIRSVINKTGITSTAL